MKRILFACIGNAMRSQMAEGLGRHLARDGMVEVRSGGTQPAGFVHPQAIRAMDEIGIDIRGQRSKPIDLAFAASADAVVTLCGSLEEACPIHIARGALDWTQPDPSWGGDEAVRQVREAIQGRIVDLYRSWRVLKE